MVSGARLTALTPHPLDDVPASLLGGVIAIGNFDGLHAGHRVLLSAARSEADRLGVSMGVLTFEPHPRTIFRPETPVFRLTPLSTKARLLKALGADGLVVADFSPAFASFPAGDFIERVLVGQLKLAAAVVGFNFHFGKGRGGNPTVLGEAGSHLGFAVKVIDQVTEKDGVIASSSAVREALAAGDIAAANARLGYRWLVTGVVVQGDRRGRELGFPTANIQLEANSQLRHGIYAVTVQRPRGAMFRGVASYGRRPTFDNGPPLLEVFLFDFDSDLYGEEIAVSFVEWLRPELKFDGVAPLVAAMNKDVVDARAALAKAGDGTALDKALQALP